MSISDIIEEWATEMGYSHYDENIEELKARVDGLIDVQYLRIEDTDDEYIS